MYEIGRVSIVFELLPSERRKSAKENICYNANSPDINFEAIAKNRERRYSVKYPANMEKFEHSTITIAK